MLMFHYVPLNNRKSGSHIRGAEEAAGGGAPAREPEDPTKSTSRICGKGYESLITSWHSSFQRNKQGTHLLCKHFLYFFYSTDKIRLRMTCVVDCNTPNLQSFHECTDQRVRSPSFCQGVPSTCSAATLGSPAICDIRLVVTSDDSQHGWFFVFLLGNHQNNHGNSDAIFVILIFLKDFWWFFPSMSSMLDLGPAPASFEAPQGEYCSSSCWLADPQ